jgi:hypothetical protein
MRLLSHAMALGVGYALGRPDGHHQLGQLRRQAVALTRPPLVRKLRERGRDLAGDLVLATRNLAARRSRRGYIDDRNVAQDTSGPTFGTSVPPSGSAAAPPSQPLTRPPRP